MKKTLHSTPKNATHWSVRLMARSQGISPATVQRIWQKHHLQAASGGVVQVQHRPAVRRQSEGYCGAVSEPAGQGDRAERR